MEEEWQKIEKVKVQLYKILKSGLWKYGEGNIENMAERDFWREEGGEELKEEKQIL